LSGTGGSFSNINAPNAIFTGSACTSYTLRWTIQGACSSSSDQISIDFQQTPNIANAGELLQTASNLTVNLAANAPANGVTGTWSIVSGTGGSFSNINSPSSTFTGVWGQTFILKWALAACLAVSIDVISITFDEELHNCGAIDVHNPSLSYGSITDQQGNLYKTIVIGAQEWMAENLKTTVYRNGDAIPNVTANFQWEGSNSGAWCSYNNNSQYDCPYGKLYNWYATSDPRNLCPTGWHIPTDAEWTVLTNYLGGLGTAGGKMKSNGTQYWEIANSGADNASGFSGLPGGYRSNSNGVFSGVGSFGSWWSATTSLVSNAWSRDLYNNNSEIGRNGSTKGNGLSVRCLRD
jgi:uncharacterized protein (TIGR02145 family)